jgi:hypothetical protein
MSIIRILILAVSLTIGNVDAASFTLSANGNEPIYQSVITPEIYQNSREKHLQDLAIYNAEGEPLPYAIANYEMMYPKKVIAETKPLLIFPMQESAINFGKDINISLENKTNNTKVDFTTKPTQQQQPAYLFDLGKQHPILKKINLEWQGAEGKLISVQAFTSDDLKHWTNIGQSVIFKSLVDGHAILQNSVELYAFTPGQYLKIIASDVAKEDFKLISVNTEYSKVQDTPLSQLWQPLVLLKREKNKNNEINIDFESSGRYPVSYLRISLPQQNTITQVNVLTRNQPDAPWEVATHSPLYRLNKEGRDTVNPDIKINPREARFWRLQFNEKSGGIGLNNPTLEVGWQPQTIIWNARGNAPYRMTVGEGGDVSAVSMASLIPNKQLWEVNTLPVADISLNTTGELAANPWVDAPDYKRWVLWAGLFLGVLALAAMSYSLLKNNPQTK